MVTGELGICAVCGGSLHHPLATYCKRCKKLIDRVDSRRKPDKKARVRALKKAWDGECFRYYYTGVKLVEVTSSINLSGYSFL